MDAAALSKAAGIPLGRAETWAGPLSATFLRFDISTPLRQAGFIAQVGHESLSFTHLEENLNYSGEALLRIFGRHFANADEAAIYARRPEAIANRVYAGRMGNGNEESGDGWRHRGMGLIQVTGAENQAACLKALGLDQAHPEALLEPGAAALSAGWYWASRKLNVPADARDVALMTKLINGGVIGLPDRQARYAAAALALGVA